MSYDLYMIVTAPGADVAHAAEELALGEPVSSLVPWNSDIHDTIICDLEEINPDLEVFVGEPDEDEPEEPAVEITHEELGLQLEVYATHATLTIPYWYAGEDCRQVLSVAWKYLAVVRQATGCAVYDPQLEVALDLDKDFERVIAEYSRVVDSLSGSE